MKKENIVNLPPLPGMKLAASLVPNFHLVRNSELLQNTWTCAIKFAPQRKVSDEWGPGSRPRRKKPQQEYELENNYFLKKLKLIQSYSF